MKTAVMYGAGNIGRGFIAQLFNLSGYETVFIDVAEPIVNALNDAHEYPIYVTNGEDYDVFNVKNVRAVNGKDEGAVAREIADCEIMATAVGANILKFIAAPVAAGIKLRAQSKKPLNIIICENLIDADKYFRSLVAEKLDGEGKAFLDGSVGMAEASVGRMVPAAPEEIKAQNPLAVCVEPYNILPIDKNGLVGQSPNVQNVQPFAPFDFYIRRKLFMHNMSHAVTAYLGYLRGYTYIWEAVADKEIRETAREALREAGNALSKEYGVDIKELDEFGDELIQRFDNKLLGDTVARVGRDTARKLAPNDRMTGAYTLCLAHGIEPTAIRAGMAAAFAFDPDGKEPAKNAVDTEGIKTAITKLTGMTDSAQLDKIADVYAALTGKKS